MIIFPFEHVFNRSSTWKVTVITSSVTLKWSPECYKINLGGLVTSVYLFHVRILTPVSRKTERWRIPAGYPQFRGRLNIVSGFLMFVTFDSGLTLKKGCGYACNFVHDSRETPFTLVMIMLYHCSCLACVCYFLILDLSGRKADVFRHTTQGMRLTFVTFDSGLLEKIDRCWFVH